MAPTITGITISLEMGYEQEYAKGTKSFISLQGKYPDPASLDQVLLDGLDMYFAAFQSLLSSRAATGVIGGAEFKETLKITESRLVKVKKILAAENAEVAGVE
jgi:hypothetical protein